MNPSPALGWEARERMSLFERGPVDAIIALALIHHLALANNVPLQRLVDLFAKLCNILIIEFIPKDDSQAQRLLANREDIFNDYEQEQFERLFREYFLIEQRRKIRDSKRTLYLMRKDTSVA